MPDRERVQQLVRQVEAGRYVEALEEFYLADASMQENTDPPRVGLANLIAGEKALLGMVRALTTRPGTRFLVDGDEVVINWTFDFVLNDGSVFSLDELAYQEWRGDRIARERFFYDPAQKTPKRATAG